MCAFSTTSTTGSYSHSPRKQLSAHRDLVLKPPQPAGLRVNWEKSKLVPMQRISFLGMEFDSVNQTARLTQERAQSVLNCFKTLSGRTAVPLKLFQRLLGHMAAAAVTVPLGLLHMRPLQHWLYGRIPRWAWKHGTYRFRLHRPAARPSGRGQIPHSFGQECPWSRYPGMLWYSQMPRPQAGEPRTTGTQYQGFGRVPNCIGISIASSC